MKHQKEWNTCDRCGKEIIPKSWKDFRRFMKNEQGNID